MMLSSRVVAEVPTLPKIIAKLLRRWPWQAFLKNIAAGCDSRFKAINRQP
jgi:hypothetical protein